MNDSADKLLIYRGTVAGVLLVLPGLFSLVVAALVPLTTKAPWLGLLFMSLPVSCIGLFLVLNGLAAIGTRLEIGPANLKAITPTWRACPLPPLQRFHTTWDRIRAVRHRKEIYCILVAPAIALVPFPVDVYAIETKEGRVVVGGRTVPRLHEAMQLIAIRSGLKIVEEKEVRASLFRTLMKGAPAWDVIW